jgi:hypothetical protein
MLLCKAYTTFNPEFSRKMEQTILIIQEEKIFVYHNGTRQEAFQAAQLRGIKVDLIFS